MIVSLLHRGTEDGHRGHFLDRWHWSQLSGELRHVELIVVGLTGKSSREKTMKLWHLMLDFFDFVPIIIYLSNKVATLNHCANVNGPNGKGQKRGC